MSIDETAAQTVIHALRGYRGRIGEILGRLEGKKVLPAYETEELQVLLTSLKRDLREIDKRGTVAVGRHPQNPVESAYFAPAVQKAAAHLSVAVNSHPIRSNWYDCLFVVDTDIHYYLHQLEEQIASAQTPDTSSSYEARRR
jgi:hypothetical protein